MKKIIALILGLAMLLCAASAVAEEKVTIGTVSINGAFRLQSALPEGYKLEPRTVTPEHVVAVIASEDPEKPIMQLSIAYDEKYFDVERMNDLDEEELSQLEQTYIDEDPEVELTYGETGYGTLVLVARHESESLDFISFFSIYRGYCVEFVLVPSETAADKNLTDEQIATCVSFLTELDFIPAGTGITGKQAVAGLKFITNLSDYDPETNTVTAVVMHSIPLPAAQVESLDVGDTLIDGQFQEVIEKIETLEDGIILINDEVELRKSGEEYHVFVYEMEYIEPYTELKVEIPDSLKIIDHIDKANGDPLEEPVTYTVEEFRAMLADPELRPDFATDNVQAAFNVNCELVSVERFYTPAQ